MVLISECSFVRLPEFCYITDERIIIMYGKVRMVLTRNL